MAQWQDGHEHRVLAEAAGTAAKPGIQHVVVVGARDQFRQGGRAAGKQHGGNLAGVGPHLGQPALDFCVVRRSGDHRAQVDLVRSGHAGDENQAQGWRIPADLGRHVAVVEIAQAIGNHIGRGPRSLEEGADLAVAMGAQRRHRNRTDARQSEVGQHEVGTVGQLQHDAVLRLDAGGEKTAGQAPRTGHQVGIAQAQFAADQRRLARMARGTALQQLRNRDAFPPAALAVARRHVGGPGHAAVEHAHLLFHAGFPGL